MLEHVILSGGTHVLCEPVARSEAVAIGFWFLHGSRDERQDERGFAHFLEHMIFKGTDQRTPLEIAREIDRVGGTINAETEKEVTALYTSVPKDYLFHVLDVMCDIAFGSVLAAEEFEKEKLVVQNEITQIEDSPEEKGFELFIKTIWGDHPLGEKIAGNVEAIDAITRDRLDPFYRRFFVSSRLIVAAAGNFDPAVLYRELEKRLSGAVSPGKGPEPPERLSPRFFPGTNVVPDSFSQAQTFYARPFPRPEKIKDYYEHLLLSTAFGESMSSRLFQTVREEEGLCYSIYSSRAYYSDTALWLLHANTMPDLTEKLLASIARELGRLRDDPISEQELDEARLQIKGSLILARQDVEVRMKRLARQFIAMGMLIDHNECFQIIDDVTRDDLSRLTGLLFSGDQANLLVYGCRELSRLQKQSNKLDFFLQPSRMLKK